MCNVHGGSEIVNQYDEFDIPYGFDRKIESMI